MLLDGQDLLINGIFGGYILILGQIAEGGILGKSHGAFIRLHLPDDDL